MDKNKLNKFFALATNNPNANEASVAALKFIKELQKTNQPINITFGEIYTKEQVQAIVNDAYKKGHNEGYNIGYEQAINDNNKYTDDSISYKDNLTGQTIIQNTTNNTIRFWN